MRAALAALALAAGAPAAALTPLDYESGLRAALAMQGCAADVGARGVEGALARQLSLSLGVPALELVDRDGPHHRALRDAVAAMAGRGLLEVDGTTITLADCGR